MKRFLLLALLALTLPAGAQTSLFRHAGMKHALQKRDSIAKLARSEAAFHQSSPMKAAIIDEAVDLQEDNDVKYRYVYAYNKDQERSSETIYKSLREDGTWGSETLITVGSYSYEYDSEGRMKTKAITYTDNDDFESFRIIADYGSETTTYKKYVISDDSEYTLSEEWEYYPNGVMASHTSYPFSDESIKKLYSENGSLMGLERIYSHSSESNSIINTGTLNDSIHTVKYVSGDYSSSYIKTYKYDPTYGHLLEFSDYDIANSTCYGNYKYEWEYDELGRMVSEKYYGSAQDDEDAGYIEDSSTYAKGSSASATETEPEWELMEQTDYTYNSDEVYSVGNAWHDALNFDGPVKSYRFWELNTEEDSDEADVDFVETIDFDYDSSGKLLSATHTQTGPKYDMSHIDMIITVDADGHITYVDQVDCFYTVYDTVSDSDYSEMRIEYVWQDNQVVRQTEQEKYLIDSEDYDYTCTTTYSYGEGSVTMTTEESEEGSPISCSTYIEEKDGRHYEYDTRQYEDSSSYTDMLIVETQTEDVIFTRPDIFKDVDGFTPEETIVASVKDRVVVYSENTSVYSYGWESRYVDYGMGWGDYPYYANMTEDTYFSIAHEGDETVCYNIEGLPVYVLEDGRLVKEFQYYDEVYMSGGSTLDEVDSSSAKLPARVTVTDSQGYSYDEIVYLYNADGLFLGKNVTEVSSDGTREEQIAIEYVYDAAGIASLEASAGVGVQLNGRRLGLSDSNLTFSVTTTGGALLASGVREFSFNTPGVYLVTVKGKTIKLQVR